jgi:formate/nitrite transporter
MNDQPDQNSLDNLLPPEMAKAAVETGVNKAHSPLVKVFALAILAGAFIAFGAVFSTVVTSGSTMSFGLTKVLSGLTFSLGLILVVVGGAELFTGNNLLIMAWASRRISSGLVLKNWLIVYLGNMLGAYSVVLMIGLSGHYLFGNGKIGNNMLHIAEAKCELGFIHALFLGILCNILVCLPIWRCYSAKSTHGKILAILFPITAFVAAGFEHSVANMYFIPMGLWVKEVGDPQFWQLIHSAPEHYAFLGWRSYLFGNLLPVTLGNMIGGSLFVGLAYWFIYASKWTLKTE